MNLVLSTLAAVQAPLIMMSQNRASDYDRLQARNDYHVNKQSKEEIRLLHEKIDHLVQQDQSDLLTIQKLQTEMLMAVSQQVEKISDDIRILKVMRLERGTHEDKDN
ncbi:Putative membrane spanning protein [Streptococcus thermophilus CNCM I-1630]|nr:Putative membrane spanning protein [Streptococcus thermophilus CNCM I-1630]